MINNRQLLELYLRDPLVDTDIKGRFLFVCANEKQKNAITVQGYRAVHIDDNDDLTQPGFIDVLESFDFNPHSCKNETCFVLAAYCPELRDYLESTEYTYLTDGYKIFYKQEYLQESGHGKRLREELQEYIKTHAGIDPEGTTDPTAAEVVDEFLETILTRQYEAIPTGYADIDRALGGGFFRQQIVMLSAAPGTGKTALAAQILEKMAEHGTDCIYYNLEMSREQMIARSLSRIGAGDLTALEIMQAFKQPAEQQEKIRETATLYKRTIAPHMKYHECGSALERILADMTEAAEKAKKEKKPAPVICIDYLHIVTSEKIKDPVEILKTAVYKFNDYAREYNTAVLIIGANNRSSNKSGASSMESGRDTSAIEYTAHVMLSLNYAEADKGGKDRESAEEIRDRIKECKDAGQTVPDKYNYLSLRITKSRFAEPNGRAVLRFDGAHAKMSQVDLLDYKRKYGTSANTGQLPRGFKRGNWPDEENDE